MDYWAATMQDDCYLIAADGWVAKPYRIVETDKKGKTKDKGWACDLVPKPLIVARYFAKEQAELDRLTAELEAATARIAELEEEHGGEEGAFAELEKINRGEVSKRLKEIGDEGDAGDEAGVLREWLLQADRETELKKKIKQADAELDEATLAKYAKLAEDDVKTLVVDDKWLTALTAAIQGELDRVSQTLTGRIRVLADRYAAPLPAILEEIETLTAKVDGHLKKMGQTCY